MLRIRIGVIFLFAFGSALAFVHLFACEFRATIRRSRLAIEINFVRWAGLQPPRQFRRN